MADCRVFVVTKTSQAGKPFRLVELWRTDEFGQKKGQFPVCATPSFGWRDVFAHLYEIQKVVNQCDQQSGGANTQAAALQQPRAEPMAQRLPPGDEIPF